MRLEPEAYKTLPWASLSVGLRLPDETLHVDRSLVVMGAATTATFFDGHMDTDYARRQGRRDIYLATGPIAGLVDRYVTSWSGPGAFLRKRRVAMRESVCAGDDITFRGEIKDLRTDASVPSPGEVGLAAVEVQLTNQFDARCVSALVTLAFPLRETMAESVRR